MRATSKKCAPSLSAKCSSTSTTGRHVSQRNSPPDRPSSHKSRKQILTKQKINQANLSHTLHRYPCPVLFDPPASWPDFLPSSTLPRAKLGPAVLVPWPLALLLSHSSTSSPTVAYYCQRYCYSQGRWITVALLLTHLIPPSPVVTKMTLGRHQPCQWRVQRRLSSTANPSPAGSSTVAEEVMTASLSTRRLARGRRND